MICSTKRRTRRSEEPVGKNACWSSRRWKRRRRRSVGKEGREGMRLLWKLSSLSKCCCVQLWPPEVLEGKTISARGRKQGLSRRKRGRGNPEDEIALKKWVYSMLIVLATMELSSVVVVMLETVTTYLATCQIYETSRAHQKTAIHSICVVNDSDFSF